MSVGRICPARTRSLGSRQLSVCGVTSKLVLHTLVFPRVTIKSKDDDCNTNYICPHRAGGGEEAAPASDVVYDSAEDVATCLRRHGEVVLEHLGRARQQRVVDLTEAIRHAQTGKRVQLHYWFCGSDRQRRAGHAGPWQRSDVCIALAELQLLRVQSNGACKQLLTHVGVPEILFRVGTAAAIAYSSRKNFT